MLRTISMMLTMLSLAAFAGCGKSSEPATDSHGHSDTDSHDHAHDEGADNHGQADDAGHAEHGAPIELGVTTIGSYSVQAARDEAALKPGGDAPIDVWLTGDLAEIVAVRFWIGAEDGAGSLKAKADIEDPAQPNHWHTHAEIPNPLSPGSKLWVELETAGEGKKVGSFDLVAAP